MSDFPEYLASAVSATPSPLSHLNRLPRLHNPQMSDFEKIRLGSIDCRHSRQQPIVIMNVVANARIDSPVCNKALILSVLGALPEIRAQKLSLKVSLVSPQLQMILFTDSTPIMLDNQ